jgi:hypothetical protein
VRAKLRATSPRCGADESLGLRINLARKSRQPSQKFSGFPDSSETAKLPGSRACREVARSVARLDGGSESQVARPMSWWEVRFGLRHRQLQSPPCKPNVGESGPYPVRNRRAASLRKIAKRTSLKLAAAPCQKLTARNQRTRAANQQKSVET